MPVDEQTQKLLRLINARTNDTFDVPTMRQLEARSLPPLALERAAVAAVDDRDIPGPAGPIPIRIYKPHAADQFARPAPLLIYFHGGGHTIGSLDSHDGICCQLTHQSGCIVVAVDYRLAPEHKFPAAVHDAYAAVEWVAANGANWGGDTSRLVVAGDSAGGNLAAAVCLLARDRAGPAIVFQILLYPDVGGRGETASFHRNGHGYLLTIKMIEWFSAQYLNSAADKQNPLFAPLLADDHSRLPPALIVTAEFDPLLDEGKSYAQRLTDSAVSVEYISYAGTIHGFISFYPWLDKGKAAIELVAARLRQRFQIHEQPPMM